MNDIIWTSNPRYDGQLEDAADEVYKEGGTVGTLAIGEPFEQELMEKIPSWVDTMSNEDQLTEEEMLWGTGMPTTWKAFKHQAGSIQRSMTVVKEGYSLARSRVDCHVMANNGANVWVGKIKTIIRVMTKEPGYPPLRFAVRDFFLEASPIGDATIGISYLAVETAAAAELGNLPLNLSSITTKLAALHDVKVGGAWRGSVFALHVGWSSS